MIEFVLERGSRLEFLDILPRMLLEEIEAGRAAVVGGAIRSHFEQAMPLDVDVFVFSRQNHKAIVNALQAQPTRPGDDSMCRIFLAIPVDIIFELAFSSPEQCSANADFDIAGGVYCSGRFYLPDRYLDSIKSRKMRFNGFPFKPRKAYERFLKYSLKYGYDIDDESLQKLLEVYSPQD